MMAIRGLVGVCVLWNWGYFEVVKEGRESEEKRETDNRDDNKVSSTHPLSCPAPPKQYLSMVVFTLLLLLYK
jgi:hypothetical protein